MSLLLKSGEQCSLHKITASMFGNVTQDEEIGRKVNPVAFVKVRIIRPPHAVELRRTVG